jgi:hypothetical protein
MDVIKCLAVYFFAFDFFLPPFFLEGLSYFTSALLDFLLAVEFFVSLLVFLELLERLDVLDVPFPPLVLFAKILIFLSLIEFFCKSGKKPSNRGFPPLL